MVLARTSQLGGERPSSTQTSVGLSHLGHVVDQQQGDGDGGDVMRAADLQDISQAHDGRVPGRDVPRAHVVVHAQVEHRVDLGQVGVPRDVELTFGKRGRGGDAADTACDTSRGRCAESCGFKSMQRGGSCALFVWTDNINKHYYLVGCWMGFFRGFCSYRRLRSSESL